MGPRSCERGNDRDNSEGHAVCDASMGPRSCERGNRSRAERIYQRSDRFNGAALVRARKFRHYHLVPLRSARASMGPRSCERGNQLNAVPAVLTLQGFNGAALVRARKSADS